MFPDWVVELFAVMMSLGLFYCTVRGFIFSLTGIIKGFKTDRHGCTPLYLAFLVFTGLSAIMMFAVTVIGTLQLVGLIGG